MSFNTRKYFNSLPLLIGFICIIACEISFAQKNSHLDQLDKETFEALEKNDTTILSKANYFLDECENFPTSIYLVNAYTILGIINKNKGYYTTSLEYNLKALNASEKINDKARISASLNNIGEIYKIQKKYNRAIAYFNQSLELEKNLKNPLQKSIRYYNIGECYKEIDSLDLALTFFNNSLLIEKKFNNLEGIIYAKLGIADVYIKIGQITDAKIVLNQIEKNIPNQIVDANIFFMLLKGKLYNLEGKYQEALEEFSKGIEFSKKYLNKTYVLELMKLQISFYEKQADWKNASLKYKEYLQLNEALNSLIIKNQLEDLAFNNELNKKQLEIKLAKENERIETNTRKYFQKVLIFLVFAVSLILGLIFYGIKKITSKNERK